MANLLTALSQLGVRELTILAAMLFSIVVFSLFVGAALNRHLFRLPRMLLRAVRGLLARMKIRAKIGWRGARKAAVTGLHQHADLHDMTAIQRELHKLDDAPGGASGGAATLYDFTEENALLEGAASFGYKLFRVPANYDGLPVSLSDDVVDVYSEMARRFFSNPVQLDTTHENLYDDEEGAVIVAMFRKADRRCFYATDRFRRIIGDNARRLIWRQLAATAFPIVVGYLLLALSPDEFSRSSVLVVISAIVVAGGGAAWTHMTYAGARNTNRAHFTSFLSRYMSMVSGRFQDADTNMSQVILGEEEDKEILAGRAQKWHRIMMWLGLRLFFIECFLRNVIFQTQRNLGFYKVLALTVLILAPLVAIIPLSMHVISEPSTWIRPSLVLGLAGVGIGAIAFAFLSKRNLEKMLNQKDWRGFDDVEMEEKMRKVIGKYAQEAAIGKRRGVVAR